MANVENSIGYARMSADRTITLTLRATSRGAIGDAVLTYAPDTSEWRDVLDHVGGLRIGESKPVRPWG